MTIKSESDLIRETHDAVLELNTKWNGGPGTWPVCVQHSKAQEDHEKRLRSIEFRIYMAVGAFVLVSIFFEWFKK